jgi:hypothetical protein
MPEYAHAPLRRSAFDLQHLCLFQGSESWMGKVERDGNARHSIWREPFVGEPEMRAKVETASIQFIVQLGDLISDLTAFHCDVEIAETQVE